MSMKFQIHNLQNGSMKECDLNNLSRSLSVDSEIVLFDGERIEAIGFVSHSLLVYFAVEFADYALQNYEKKKIPKAEECISLVRKWIENPNSVSKEELEDTMARSIALKFSSVMQKKQRCMKNLQR